MPSRPVSAVDPVFTEIAKAIYGDIDVRELAKAGGPDSSTVHIDQPVGTGPSAKALKDQKRVAAIGLGATGVAGVAGVHAISATVKENAARSRAAAGLPPLAVKEGKMMGRVARVLRVKPTTAAAVVGGGALALHGVELVGDALGAHAQLKAIRASNAAAGKQPVEKAFRLKPLNVAGLKVPSLRAKRVKMTPTLGSPKTQAGVFQPVTKLWHPVRNVQHTYHGVRDVLNNVQVASVNANTAAASARDVTDKAKRLIPTRQAAVLAGVGTVGALAGATYLGNRSGKKAQLKQATLRPRARTVTKSAEVTWTGEITKVDVERRQVFGWASVSRMGGKDIVDLQGDIVPIDEVEKSAYQYVIESRKGGDMHRRVSKFDDGSMPLHTADMIESFVVTPEKLEKMGLPADSLPLGWWVGYHVNDEEQWQLVKSGGRTGFSIHGKGTRTAVSKVAGDGGLKDRFRQAAHPPAVKLHHVDSSAINAMGYQPQTKRLAYEMHSRSGIPYNYKAGAGQAFDAAVTSSKGHYYATKVRGKNKQAEGYSVADRARLFAHPQVSKAEPKKVLRPVDPRFKTLDDALKIRAARKAVGLQSVVAQVNRVKK